jgi:poly(A)-specific ribonuclease
LSEFGLIRAAVSHDDPHHKFQCLRNYSSAVAFLLKNKFRFDLPFSEGIPYLSRKEEGQIRASWAVRDAERAAIEDMVLKIDDKALVDHIHLSVRNWLSQPLVQREDYLNIPHITPESPRAKHVPTALNRYQMRLTHQIIRKDYANLKTLGRDGFVRITIRNEKEDAEERLRQERYRELDVINAIEFRWLVEALCGGDISNIPERCFLAAIPSDVKPNKDDAPYRRFVEDLQSKLNKRRRVLFGHNCFIDLVYLYTCFIGDPPAKVEDFQELIHGLFPAVVDTKYLASLVKELRFNSNLEALEKEMRPEQLPIIDVPVAFDRYIWRAIP